VSICLAAAARSSACSRHLYPPCFSDKFCSCPRVLLLPLPPERASLELGITPTAPLWLRSSREPWDTVTWCASHCRWLQTSKAAEADIKKSSNIILKSCRVPNKGCNTKSWISTPSFCAGKIQFKSFTAVLGAKTRKEVLVKVTTGDFGKKG